MCPPTNKRPLGTEKTRPANASFDTCKFTHDNLILRYADMIHWILNLINSHFRSHKLGARAGGWRTVEKHFLIAHPICAVCGGKKWLQVHHKKPFHLHPELELDDKNLITLCMGRKECHLKIGHGNNWKAYNPHVELDAMAVTNEPTSYDAIVIKANASRLF
jgi:5-methylcytosine-specific restriction protein A